MKRFSGIGVSNGYAIGTLCYISRDAEKEKTYIAGSSEEEKNRFESAQAEVIAELGTQASRLMNEGQSAAAELMEAHAQLAEDPDYTDAVFFRIEREGKSAPTALLETGDEFAEMFEEMPDASMAARAADVRDITSRIKNRLYGFDKNASARINLSVPSILGAVDFTPSETVMLDRSKVLAIVTSEGNPLGHTAIIAKSFGIPAIVGAGLEFNDSYNGSTVIIDGFQGLVIVDPDQDTISHYEQLLDDFRAACDELDRTRSLPDETADGKPFKLYCNIQTPAEVSRVLDCGGRGIGLFRSEFLFLSRESAPSEEEQFKNYCAVLSGMHGQEVIIRTLDIGADKTPPYMDLEKENNPALGIRGLRLCLQTPDLFRTQLRALYRASAYGNLKIMFPMVTDLQEVLLAKEICHEVIRDLQSEGISFNADVPLGIMIETPAAALMSEELAKEVDFFSIGTNDLYQYTLACDRSEKNLSSYFSPYHAAFLKLIETTIQGAHKACIEVGICGELAADVKMTETLLDMGIDELSVSPGVLLTVRNKIRNIRSK